MKAVTIPASRVQGPLFVKLGSFPENAELMAPEELGEILESHLKKFTIPDLEEASRLCRTFRDEENLSAHEWAGGEVCCEETGLCVAVVSYNGRVWFPGGRSLAGFVVTSNVEYDLSA